MAEQAEWTSSSEKDICLILNRFLAENISQDSMGLQEEQGLS